MQKFFFIVLFSIGCSLHGASHKEPSFDSCMRTDMHYRKYLGQYPREWARVKDLFVQYQKNRARAHLSKAAYRIPKKVHMIWLGSSPPEFVRTMFESWKKFHPLLAVKLWTNEDVVSFHLKNQGAYDKAKNWGEKSDIFRYEILEREGGIYVDSDFECIRPFDDICKTADFFTGVAYSEGAPHFYNGLIGCCQGHPIVKKCVETIREGNGNGDFLRILYATGPHFFTACFYACLNAQEASAGMGLVAPFPITYFYPFPDVRRESYENIEAVKRDWLHPETFAIHYWKLSWLQS